MKRWIFTCALIVAIAAAWFGVREWSAARKRIAAEREVMKELRSFVFGELNDSLPPEWEAIIANGKSFVVRRTQMVHRPNDPQPTEFVTVPRREPAGPWYLGFYASPRLSLSERAALKKAAERNADALVPEYFRGGLDFTRIERNRQCIIPEARAEYDAVLAIIERQLERNEDEMAPPEVAAKG
ncbi:MAG: hypothetical protein WD069_20735 [Planctomycetales bacterium]